MKPSASCWLYTSSLLNVANSSLYREYGDFLCGYVSSTLVELHLNRTGNFLLRHVYESADRFPQRSEPQSVINQLGEFL